MLARPERRTEIFISVCCVIDIEYKGLASVVTDFGMLTAVLMSHKCTSKNGFDTVYAEFTRLDRALVFLLQGGRGREISPLSPYILAISAAP